MLDLLAAYPQGLAALAAPAGWTVVADGLPPEARTWPRRAGPGSHEHGHRELLFVLAGEGGYGLGGRCWRGAPGTWYAFAPFSPHDNGYLDAGRDFAHLWISLLDRRAFARVFTASRGRFAFSALAALPGDAGAHADAACAEAEALAARSPALARARLVGGLAAIAAVLLAPAPTVGADAQEHAIDAILGHVAHHAGAGVSLAHLARIAGYSPWHFARVFRRRTGMTVHAYVDQCRRRAYLDLRARGESHRAIGDRLGFSCASAFSRWLRGQRPRLTVRDA